MKFRKIFIIILILLSGTSLFSQSQFGIHMGSDVVSRFIFRGSNVGGNSLHIQPILSISNDVLEIGTFGSFGVSNYYSEIDLYLVYNLKYISMTFTNYNMPISVDINGNYNRKTSINVGEISLKYKGSKYFPSVLVATNIYGDLGRYSTYIELGYPLIHVGDTSMDVFVGISPFKGYYVERINFVNIGIRYCKDIQITDDFSLPLFTSICGNGERKEIHLSFGISL